MPSTPVNALGVFLRARMAEQGIAPDELADRCRVSRATLYRWLSHEPPDTIDVAHLESIAAAIAVPVDILRSLWRGSLHEVRSTVVTRADLLAWAFADGQVTEAELRRAVEAARLAAQRAKGGRRPSRSA